MPGKRQATVRIAEARDQAFATFHSTLLTALEDVENALVALSRERVRAAKLTEMPLVWLAKARVAVVDGILNAAS